MSFSLDDPETFRLAREIAKLTGEDLREAVRKALTERLDRERHKRMRRKGIAERLNALARECAALPDVDTRTPEEIIGYDEYGLPR